MTLTGFGLLCFTGGSLATLGVEYGVLMYLRWKRERDWSRENLSDYDVHDPYWNL